VVPFGGGTNIVGGVEHRDGGGFTRVTLDMRRMGRLLDLTRGRRPRRWRPGAVGPCWSRPCKRKATRSVTIPTRLNTDLGGWLATRPPACSPTPTARSRTWSSP
jgi:FAD/FMN-containing dehydrogenase